MPAPSTTERGRILENFGPISWIFFRSSIPNLLSETHAGFPGAMAGVINESLSDEHSKWGVKKRKFPAAEGIEVDAEREGVQKK